MTAAALDHAALAAPVLVALLTSIACVLAGRDRRRQQVLGMLGTLLHLCASVWLLIQVNAAGIIVTHLGGWPAPYGIAFAADRLAAIMVLLASIIATLTMLFGIPTLRGASRVTRYTRLAPLMLAGLSGIFLTADLFNFYVWFELVLICSFGLMVITGGRSPVEGATKYFVINIVGSMLLLTSIGLLYGMTGTLNMAELARRMDFDPPHLVTAIGGLLMVAMGIKAAAFPLFFWLPASYHTPPIVVIALFGGLLTKVGIYGLIRLFTLLFVHDIDYTHTALLAIGAMTMITGVLGAVTQTDLRRLLSFHIISQIGYMLVALGFYSTTGVAAALFFMIHIVFTKTALFFISGVIARTGGSFKLSRLGGLSRRRPLLAVLFLAAALSLGGMPPLSGFIGKLLVIQAALEDQHYLMAAIALGVGLLTLYSMAKIWTIAFWSPPYEVSEEDRRSSVPLTMWIPPATLAALAVALGLTAGPVLEFCFQAAEELMERTGYIDAVLAEGRS